MRQMTKDMFSHERFLVSEKDFSCKEKGVYYATDELRKHCVTQLWIPLKILSFLVQSNTTVNMYTIVALSNIL